MKLYPELNIELRTSDDWQVLYINGEKMDSNHRIDLNCALTIICELANFKYLNSYCDSDNIEVIEEYLFDLGFDIEDIEFFNEVYKIEWKIRNAKN